MIAVVREPNITQLRDALFQVVHRGNLDFKSGECVIVAGDVKVTWKPGSHVEIQYNELCYQWNVITGCSTNEIGSPKQLQEAVIIITDHLKRLDTSLEQGFEQFRTTRRIA